MNKYDIIIIGAGISGLSLAHYCSKADMKTLVIEKSERVGGSLHSHYFEDIDFWIELGAHTCYNSYSNLISIMEECSAITHIIRREKVPFKMLVDGSIKSIPSQLNFVELLFSAPRLFALKKSGQSVSAYYSKIIGRKNFDKVLSPALNAVISQDASNFPADMLFKKRPRRKDIIKKFTLTNGVQTITDSISSQKAIEIATKGKVISIEYIDGCFKTYTDNVLYESESLAIATPASVTAQLLKENFPEISKDMSQIKVEAIESVGIAVKKDLTASIPPVAGIIPSSNSFYSVVSRDTVKHNTYRGFTFHFRPGILNNDAKLKRIAEALGIKTAQIEHIITKENFVPSLKVGHDSLIAKIEQSISTSRLLLTGNYFDGMAIEDCVLRSLKEFMRLKKLMGSI